MLSPLFFGYRDFETLLRDLNQELTVHSQNPDLNIRLEPTKDRKFVVVCTTGKHGSEQQIKTSNEHPIKFFDMRDAFFEGLKNAETLGMIDHIKVAFESGTVVRKDGRTKFNLEEALEVMEHTEATDGSREAIYMAPIASVSPSLSMKF